MPNDTTTSTTTTDTSSTSSQSDGFDWGTRLDSLLDSAVAGKDPYQQLQPPDVVETTETKPGEEVKPAGDTDIQDKDEEDKSKEPVPDKDKGTEESKTLSEIEKEFPTPKNATEKATAKWGELRTKAAQAAELATKVADMEKRLKEAESAKAATNDSETAAEVERLRKINEGYEAELAVSRVEATKAWKESVVAPMESLAETLVAITGKYSSNPSKFMEAFAEADLLKQSDLLTELAADMNERDRLKVYGLADRYSSIMQTRDKLQADAKEKKLSLETERASAEAKAKEENSKTEAAAKAEYEKAVTKVFEDLKKTVPVLADPEVSADVLNLASKDYSAAPPDLKAYMAHSGAILPHILKVLREKDAELAKANSTISEYRKGSPKASKGSADVSRSAPGDVDFLAAIDQQLG
jgi:hypothetical protein